MRCRAGDLALVIGARDPVNNGIMCNVVQLVLTPSFEMPNGLRVTSNSASVEPRWLIQSLGSPFRLIRDVNGIPDIAWTQYAIAHDSGLLPIRPEFDNQITNEMEKQT